MEAVRWSRAARDELETLERAVPPFRVGRLRRLAQEIAARRGAARVERLDVCQALGRLYGREEG